MKVLFLFAVLFLSTVSVFAQLDGNPENCCRNGFFPRESEDFSIGKIKGKKGEQVFIFTATLKKIVRTGKTAV